MALGYFGSPHGNITFDGVKDPETHRALEELDSALNDLEESIRKATIAGPLKLASYLLADLPTPADYEGCIVYVSDTNTFVGSDGTNWIGL